MKLSVSEPGIVVSGVIHVAILAALLLTFTSGPKIEDLKEAVPIETVSEAEYQEIMRGDAAAKTLDATPAQAQKRSDVADVKPETALPEAQKDTPPPAADPAPPEPEAASPPPPPPPAPEPPPTPEPPPPPAPEPPPPPAPEPPPRPADPPPTPPIPVPAPPPPLPPPPPPPPVDEPIAPAPVPPPRPEPIKPAEPPPRPEPPVPPKPEPMQKPEPLKSAHHDTPKPLDPKPLPPKPHQPERPKSDALAKLLDSAPTEKLHDEKPVHKAVAKPHPAADPPATQRPFDVTDISHLLNTEPPAAKPATAHNTGQAHAVAGSTTSNSQKMANTMWDQLDGVLEDQYKQCWSYLGLETQKYIPQIKVLYTPDGSLSAEPVLINPPSDPALLSLAQSAMRAVRRCNPLRIPAQFAPYYDQWKGRVLRFDPIDMAG